MKISIAGKKLVVAPGYKQIWDPATGSYVKLTKKVGDTVVFINEIKHLRDLVDTERVRSVHYFDIKGECIPITLTVIDMREEPDGSFSALVGDIPLSTPDECSGIQVINRLFPHASRWIHSDDRDSVPMDWQWGECVDRNNVVSDLVCFLQELPLGEKASTFAALQQRLYVAMMNP